MHAKTRVRKNRIQNLLIFLLSITAVLLFAQTQMSNLGLEWTRGQFPSLLDGEVNQASGQEAFTLSSLSTPVQVAVNGPHGRLGLRNATTTDPPLAGLSPRLGEGLGSAGNFAPCKETEFRRALMGDSLCFDFGHQLPLPVLAALVGVESQSAGFDAQLLVLATDGRAVRLYLLDESGNCFVSPTAVSATAFLADLAEYEGEEIAFAFELGESYREMAPYALLGRQAPTCPVLSVTSSLTDSDSLLRLLDFNPHTNNRYLDAAGAEVIVEGGRNLRLQVPGTLSYQSSESDSTLFLPTGAPLPTEQEAALDALVLVRELLSGRLGEAELYLTGVHHQERQIRITLGLHHQGVPIHFADGTEAAELELRGNTVVRLSLHLRQYMAEDASSFLLPMAQAVAVARAYPGAALNAGYLDNGASSLSAVWLAE